MGLLSGSGSAAYKSVDRTNFVATAGQTTFTLSQGYAVGDIDVFLNGVKLVDGDDYTALNGSTIILSSAAVLNDGLQVVSYNQFSAANTYTKTESDTKYMVASGINPMTSYLRTPNYGVSSWSDSANASLEASQGGGTSGVGIKAWGRSVAVSGGDIHYVSDTRGVGGGHRFYTWNGTALTKVFEVKPNGVLNKPSQPAMYFTGTQNDYAARDGSGYVPFNYLMGGISDGGLGTGIWTCQNAGTYLIAQHTLIASVNAYESRIYKNGVIASRAYNSSGRSTAGTIVLNMNVGDYIQWHCDFNVYLHQTSQYSALCIVKVA